MNRGTHELDPILDSNDLFGGSKQRGGTMIDLPHEKIPEPLKRKLVFGDREQINALAELDRQITEQEKITKAMAEGTLKKFTVKVAVDGHTYVDVWATDEAHAEEVAEDMEVDLYDFKFNYDYYATEQKGKS